MHSNENGVSKFQRELVSETLVASKAGKYTVFLFFFCRLLYPAGGALACRAVLRGWNGGAHPTLRFPWRSVSLRSGRSWSDRRAHLDGTQCFEGQRRREDRPVFLSQEPHTAENHARNESLRGWQDIEISGSSSWTLFTFHFDPNIPITLSGWSLRPPFVVQSGSGMWNAASVMLLWVLSVSAELRQDTEPRRLPPPGKLDFGYVPAGVYETVAHYEPGPIGILFQLVQGFLQIVQPNAFPQGKHHQPPTMHSDKPSIHRIRVCLLWNHFKCIPLYLVRFYLRISEARNHFYLDSQQFGTISPFNGFLVACIKETAQICQDETRPLRLLVNTSPLAVCVRHDPLRSARFDLRTDPKDALEDSSFF